MPVRVISMYRTLFVFVALLSGCLSSTQNINFGNDSSESANFDGQCDDNRFIGPQRYYMHFDHGGHNFRDATDCRELLASGRIRLRTAQEARDDVIATDL